MWTSFKLKELNVAFNLLSELPLSEEVVKYQNQFSDQSDFDSDSIASSSTDNIFEAVNVADYESSDNTSLDETRSLQSRNTLNR